MIVINNFTIPGGVVAGVGVVTTVTKEENKSPQINSNYTIQQKF